MELLYKIYEQAFWNSLYRANKQQRGYLLTKLVKPYLVSVDAVFCQIDVLTSLLPHFSPKSSGEELATAA